jgi:hypothetical protein
MRHRVCISFSPEVYENIEIRRGHVPRSVFVDLLLKTALSLCSFEAKGEK